MISPITIYVLVIVAAGTFALAYYALRALHLQRKKRLIREKLPKDLATWRTPGDYTENRAEGMWDNLNGLFCEAGYTLWKHTDAGVLRMPTDFRDYPLSSGFVCSTLAREKVEAGAIRYLYDFQYRSAQQCAARTSTGHDVIIRIIVLKNQGQKHLKILRKLATGVTALWHTNHTLPMFAEFQPFEDVVFGIFPKVGGQMSEAYGAWAKNSAGDVVEMILQMLEALEFIHSQNVAHRDAFLDNFVVQWHPESLLTMDISPSRPRVYLIDFEVAVEFPDDWPLNQRVVTGIPLGGSLIDSSNYTRPLPREVTSGKPYCPFKLDVWQLGTSLSNFKTTIPLIDEILLNMRARILKNVPSATEALRDLKMVVYTMPPDALLIEPSAPSLLGI